MSKRIVVTASKDAKNRRIQASKTTEDMLNAFEAKLAEAGIESSTEIKGSAHDIDDRAVYISESDYSVKFKDVGGGFPTDNEIISLGEIKEWWNANNEGDPVLAEYPDFDSWWIDTRRNYLQDYYEDEYRY